MPKKYQKIAMSKPVGKVLDSKPGKVGVKVGNKIIKAAKAPGKLLKRKWEVNQAYRNKNDTYDKFMQNNKFR
jgi:hypothetical protein